MLSKKHRLYKAFKEMKNKEKEMFSTERWQAYYDD